MHKSNGGYDFWDKEKDKILDLYFNQNLSTNKIAEIYGCHGKTICNQFRRWNIKLKERYNSLYSVNTKFFEVINTEEKAYFLGLLFADGHISKNNCLMLTMKDLDIIEKFKKSIESEHPIKYNKDKNPTINIRSKKICEDLKKIGFNNKKSYFVDFEKILSFIPKELLNHFVRGMFDGDGSIKIYEYSY